MNLKNCECTWDGIHIANSVLNFKYKLGMIGDSCVTMCFGLKRKIGGDYVEFDILCNDFNLCVDDGYDVDSCEM